MKTKTLRNKLRRASARMRLPAGTHKLECRGVDGRWINTAPTMPNGRRLNSIGGDVEMFANLFAAKLLRPHNEWRVAAVRGGGGSIEKAVNQIARRRNLAKPRKEAA